jgi:hypothetical protein
MALYRLVCALGHQGLVTVLTRCGLALPIYQKSAEDHERQPVGECQKLKRITSFRVPRASARGYLLCSSAVAVYVERSRSISIIRGPQRRPWQPPLPEPVRRLISSLVRTPVSSTFQNTLFLMPLQMHTTFMPSKRVRGSGDIAGNTLLSGHCEDTGAWVSDLEGIEDSGHISVSGSAGESQAGPSKPTFVGSSPAKPFFSLLE